MKKLNWRSDQTQKLKWFQSSNEIGTKLKTQTVKRKRKRNYLWKNKTQLKYWIISTTKNCDKSFQRKDVKIWKSHGIMMKESCFLIMTKNMKFLLWTGDCYQFGIPSFKSLCTTPKIVACNTSEAFLGCLDHRALSRLNH